MRQGKMLSCALLAGMLSSVALAGGPFGAPMATLSPGQWAVDAGYWYETMDLWGDAGIDGMDEYWDTEAETPGFVTDDVWGEDARLRLTDFKVNSYLGSLEYGVCENWQIFVRLGATSAKGDIAMTQYTEDLETGEWVDVDNVPFNFDFGTGFTWQVGTAFTICRSGAWTWGGRMQFGMVSGSSDTVAQHLEDTGNITEGLDYKDTFDSETEADLDWWQAVAYVGPTYQLSDALSIYAAGGWQTLHGSLDAKYTETYLETEIDTTGETDVSTVTYGNRESGEGTFTMKHASAIGVFGAAWSPSEKINVGVDVLIGEAGKWGIGVSGVYAF